MYHLIYYSSILAYNYIAISHKIMSSKSIGRHQFTPVTAKTVERVNKIKQVLTKALGEVHYINTRRRVSPSNSPTNKRRSDESSQSQSIQQILTNLKKGYLMLKHNQKSPTPHNKFVYLSQDNRMICWKSIEKEDEKSIELSTITKVVKEGAEYYLKSNLIKDINRCLIIISTVRTLQLETKSEMEAEYFKYQLERAIKYSKGMRLNYKYWKS